MLQNDRNKNNDDYLARVRSRINKKKFRLLRDAHAISLRRGEELQKECMAKLGSISKKINEKKIAVIIKKAEALIKEHLAHDPYAIVRMLLKLLKNIAEHTDVEITAHPKDVLIIRASLSEIAIANASARKVVLVEDSGLEPGSLLVKANKSIIDAHIKTKLEQARDLLFRQTEMHNGRAH